MINYFVMLGSFLDLVLTYNFLSIYRKRFPDKDYTAVESNPLVRNAVKSMGLCDGMVVSGAIMLTILVVLLAVIPNQWKYFLAGVYYMMVCFHLLNFLSLKRMEVKNGRRKRNPKTSS